MLSEHRGVSQLRLHLAAGLDSAMQGWSNQLARYEATRARLVDRESVLKQLGFSDRLPRAVRQLDSRIENLHARMRAVDRSRMSRWPHVLALWLRGGYSDFAGWKSAAKDMIRP